MASKRVETKEDLMKKEIVLTVENNEISTSGNYYRVEMIAGLFGVSVRRIQQLTQEGILKPVKIPGGRGNSTRYELVPTIQNYIKHLSEKANGKVKFAREFELKEQKMQAEIALKESQGELHRMKTDIAAGKFIDIEEVQLDYNRFFITFKKFALSLPSRLSGRISGYCEPLEVRKIEKDLSLEVNRLLNDFVVAATAEERKSGLG